jgi:hypothetical protein
MVIVFRTSFIKHSPNDGSAKADKGLTLLCIH